jgi:tetratricopeptide (TPR) repeat protein
MTRSLAAIALLVVVWTPLARGDRASEALQLLDRGIAHFQAGRLEEAREALARARDLVPDKANPHRWLGLVYARMGRCEDASHELQAFIERVPRDDPRVVEAATLRDRCATQPATRTVESASRTVEPTRTIEPARTIEPGSRTVEPPRTVESAASVVAAPASTTPHRSRTWIAGVVVGAAVVVALGVGLGVGLGTASSSPTTLTPIHGGNN